MASKTRSGAEYNAEFRHRISLKQSRGEKARFTDEKDMTTHFIGMVERVMSMRKRGESVTIRIVLKSIDPKAHSHMDESLYNVTLGSETDSTYGQQTLQMLYKALGNAKPMTSAVVAVMVQRADQTSEEMQDLFADFVGSDTS